MNDVPLPEPIEPAGCPVCGKPEIVELPKDWQAQVERQGKRVAIVGCGNPWHYRAVEFDGFQP